ncbi:MAG: T9SS type A sorting domain-containing protein [Bacteroidota bacterium]
MRSLTLLLFVLSAVPGLAQDLPPGAGFTWERLGTPPFDAEFFTHAPDGSLWSSGVSIDYDDAIYVYDEVANTWRDTTSIPNDAEALVFLSPDTLLVHYRSDVHRSVDGGRTWEETYNARGEDLLVVAPLGLPRSGGRLFTGGHDRRVSRHTYGLAYSTDRGRSFIESVYDPALFGTDAIRAWTMAILTRGPHSGRVLHGGLGGIAISDDGGESFRPSGLWEIDARGYSRFGVRRITEGEGPDGQPRVFALYGNNEVPHLGVSYSDDGGDTWGPRVPLPDVLGGIGSPGALVWLGAAGQPRSMLVLLSAGYIYRTDDGGETWSLAGRAPVPDPDRIRLRNAFVDAEGRLVVSLPHLGTEVHGVYRTVNPLPVANAAEVPESARLGVRVEPNPSTGQTTARWQQTESGAVRVSVFDTRGREVLVIADGPRQVGEQSAEIETSALAPGVYVVRLVTEAGRMSAPFTVVR